MTTVARPGEEVVSAGEGGREGCAVCPGCGARFRRSKGVWRDEADFRPAAFGEERHEGLRAIEDEHFWFTARDRLVEHWFEAERRGAQPRVIDLGCGSGRFLSHLATSVSEVVGVDGHPGPLERAASRLPNATFIHADLHRVPLAGCGFDVAFALDVLEHVEPDAFLAEAARLVRPGGGLLVSVPALPMLWSRVDEAAGHRCRYDVAMLRSELARSGFTIERVTHYQMLLLPLVLASRLTARRRERASERRPARLLNSILARVNAWEVERFHERQLPWGSSIVVLARRA